MKTTDSHDPAQGDKNQLREKLIVIRNAVDPDLAEAASLGVWNILQEVPEYQKARGIGAFASIPHEINTYPILEGTLAAGKKLYLPKIMKDKAHFEFYPVQDLKNLQPGPYDILEPTGNRAAEWEEMDMVLVPGLAFDRAGRRLGFGKGYYDRALPLLKSHCLSVGLGYCFQIVDQVPAAEHDVPVKAILCESGFRLCVK